MMSNNRALRAARCPLMLAAVLALGLAPVAGAARAQGEPDKPAAASGPTASPPAKGASDQKPSPVGGVTVEAPRPGSGGAMIPDDKLAALAAQAARDKAWRDYRRSMPPLTGDVNDMSKDYPGLQSYLPKQ